MTRPLPLPLVLRAGYGLALLAAPERLLALGAPSAAPSWAPGIVRVLGARHVLQAVVTAARPRLGPLGAVVDVLHAATDVLAAATIPPMRTPALFDTVVAGGLAASAWSGAHG